jgi:hypothetical protein
MAQVVKDISGAMRWSLTSLTVLHPITWTLPSGINMDQLAGAIFRDNEMVPDIIDRPPSHHLDLTFRYKYGSTGRSHIQGQ